jgi:glucose-6-phosphate 1-dehydrogenase
MIVEIDLPEWRGVPIRIESGKKLAEKTTDITIVFKDVNHDLWEREGCKIEKNQIRINVQPHNDIHLKLNSEFYPAEKCALPTNLHFGFKDNKFLLKDPYENALHDLFLHDQSIFIGSQEILLAWKFIDSVLRLLDPVRMKHLQTYDKLHLPKR